VSSELQASLKQVNQGWISGLGQTRVDLDESTAVNPATVPVLPGRAPVVVTFLDYR
jgi:hypothetical protein